SSPWPSSGRVTLPEREVEHVAPEETMSPDERGAIILAKLRAQLRYCWERSPFYRRLWEEAGVFPESVRSLDDLALLPVVKKDMLREDQAADPPFGSKVCCPPEAIAHIHGTSGTTGRPTAFAISRDDWLRIAAAHARIMWSFGLRPSDSVYIGSFFSLYLGSWGALIGAEALGARAFPFGAGVPGQTERALEYLDLIKPTAFYGTPSYALHLAKLARERGIDPSSLSFRVMFFSGEAGAGIPATKRRIEETFDAACIDTGTMAEMTPWMTNSECSHRTGMHLWDDIVYTEIVDPDTGAVIDGDGEGVPVYTHLERTSQPMIRLWSGDLTRVTSEPCPCGRTYRRLPDGVYGRVDDMLIIRGVNVYPNVVENALAGVRGVGPEYRIVVERPAELDVFLLEIESDDEAAGMQVLNSVKTATGLTPQVTIHAPGTLETTEFKSRRVTDRRGAS
ncbi:MAG: phenylacetate--CoA ligase family protein, partial [Gaiellales bacterium]